MKYSNNNIAEMLVKDLGAAQAGPPGTWDNGRRRRAPAARRAGRDAERLPDRRRIGACRRATGSRRARCVDALRVARASFAFGPELESALPIAGRDGTLSHRAAGAADAVRAKTGLLAGAASLSGYARTRDGTDLVFSLLVNDYQRGDADVMAAIDGFAAALVQ